MEKFKTLFSIACLIFAIFLLVVVYYEVLFNDGPRDEDKQYRKYLDDRYGLPQAFGYQIFCYHELLNNDSNFRQVCFDEPYPEGYYDKDGYPVIDKTKPIEDNDDKDDDKKKHKDKDKDKEKDEDQDDNKYSIQVCPPKCGKSDDNEDEEDDKDE